MKGRKSKFTEGFVCAVASLVKMHGANTESDDLLGSAGSVENILASGDPHDIQILRDNGYFKNPDRPLQAVA